MYRTSDGQQTNFPRSVEHLIAMVPYVDFHVGFYKTSTVIKQLDLCNEFELGSLKAALISVQLSYIDAINGIPSNWPFW